MEAPTSTKGQSRLAIVHLLGWTLACGVVLALLRAGGEYLGIPEPHRLRAQLAQLGFGLAYGTALGGLGLFFGGG